MLDIMHDMNQEAIQQSMLAFDAVEDETCTAYLAQQEQLCSCCGKPVNDWCDDSGMCIACHHGE